MTARETTSPFGMAPTKVEPLQPPVAFAQTPW
jgi:hypothetical protein